MCKLNLNRGLLTISSSLWDANNNISNNISLRLIKSMRMYTTSPKLFSTKRTYYRMTSSTVDLFIHTKKNLYFSNRYYSSNSVPTSKSNKSSNNNNINKEIITTLWSHLWPNSSKPGSFMIKLRVVTSFTLLCVAKVIGVEIPFIFKKLVDTLADTSTMSADAIKWYMRQCQYSNF